jgi:enoyl-CoA hydratase
LLRTFIHSDRKRGKKKKWFKEGYQMNEKAVLYCLEDHVAKITLNRPHRLNAINGDLLENLVKQLKAARADSNALSVILTGAGRAFCAGEDLKETSEGKTFNQWVKEVDALQDIQRIIMGLGKPLIAAVNGYALGGGLEFALSADIRIAAHNATFGFPETGVGLTVTTSGTKLISQIVGLGKAKEMILTGDFIHADEALKIGLVNQVVPEDQLLEQALKMCQKINSRSPLATKLSRVAIDLGLHSSFEQTLEIEAAHLLACIHSEGQQGYVERQLERMRKNED